MDEDTGSSDESGREYQLLLSAIQEEEQEFRAGESEIDAAVAEQMTNLQRDLK